MVTPRGEDVYIPPIVSLRTSTSITWPRVVFCFSQATSSVNSGMAECERHGNREACSKCMYRNYKREVVFKKILSPSDIQRRGSYRFYIPRPHAARFWPRENEVMITFYDVQMRRWPMRFRTSGGNGFLSRGWIQFAREKQLEQGDTITLDEVRCGQRTRFFMIGISRKDRVQILGAPIN
ncbi:B3 domain-containing transcription factor NGA4-like [Alnus glutinosa]|uniref:B3 domain-containing transcription factor NGA4-like n=1 Tax=Alnus glutinosa TaxID=3517 RepID=UPI002D77E73A|nr:B3 domain-containing transcription factor NGA4-like [Alnus glutinosa]